MRVFLERTRQHLISHAKDVSSLLTELSLNPETVLVVRNGVLVPEDELLAPDDDVKVLSVISGG